MPEIRVFYKWGALAAYGIFWGWASFWPRHIDSAGPLHQIQLAIVAWAAKTSLFSWRQYDQLQFIENIFMYIPLGVGAALIFRNSPWKALAFGSAMSVLAETIQLLLPGRTASLLDVLANASGVLLGLLALQYWQSLKNSKQATKFR